MNWQLCPWESRHRDFVIGLIDAVYREYEDAICLDGADADLLDVEANYRRRGGEFVVIETGDANRLVVGAHAVLPIENRPGVCTFRRLYLASDLRGQGFGAKLMTWAIDWALSRGFERVEFWSDTRFSRAHTFFDRLGLVRNGEVRHMNDGLIPYSEYFFSGHLPTLRGS